MVGTEFMHREKRIKVNALGDFFSGGDSERWLNLGRWNRGDRFAILARDLKPEPSLAGRVAKINVSPREIRYADRRHQRFVGDVLKALELDIDLDLGFGFCGEKQKAYDHKYA